MWWKLILKRTFLGVAWGCIVYVVLLYLNETIVHWGDYLNPSVGLELYPTILIISSLVFFLSSLIYEVKKIALLLKVFINMFIGTTFFCVVSYFSGLMPKYDDKVIFTFVFTAIAVGLVAWLVTYLILRLNAQRINKKIKEKQRDDDL